MAWKLSFRQNYRTTFSSTVPPLTVRISRVVAGRGGSWQEKWESLKAGKSNGNLPLRNLSRLQRARAIPVTWLNFGSCKTGLRAECLMNQRIIFCSYDIIYRYKLHGSRNSSVGIAILYRLDGPWIESRCAQIFLVSPDRPWGPPNLLYNMYRVSFLVVKLSGSGVVHPTPLAPSLKKE